MAVVITPSTPERLDHVRDLMRAFVAWHRERHKQDHALIDTYGVHEAGPAQPDIDA